jgi:hypothetical protein
MRHTQLRPRRQFWIAFLPLGLLSVLGTTPVDAQQYRAPGPSPISAVPPNTATRQLANGRLSAPILGTQLDVVPTYEPQFDLTGNVLAVVDPTELQLTSTVRMYSSSDGAAGPTASDGSLGTLPAGTIVTPLFVRGPRVYVHIEDTDSHAWVEEESAPDTSD